jgi:hypothetical protein
MGRLSATLKSATTSMKSREEMGVAAIGHCRTTLLAIVEGGLTAAWLAPNAVAQASR